MSNSLEELLRCFRCKTNKPLNEFPNNNREYQIKAWKGKCCNCFQCFLEQCLESMGTAKFNFETKQFDVIKFKTEKEVYSFIEKEKTKFMSQEIEKAKETLRAAGYFTDNLWHIDDVKINFKITDEDAQKILEQSLTNEWIMEQIHFCIKDFAIEGGFKKIKHED
jgi:hypothetical protein